MIHCRGDRSGAAGTLAAVRASGVKAAIVEADLSVADECEELWLQASSNIGDVPNILINNASHFTQAVLQSTSAAEFDYTMDVNVRAPMLLAKSMARDLPQGRAGKIVNVNDRRMVYVSRFAFGVSNAAKTALTKSLAVSLAPAIQVNEIALGPILALPESDALTGKHRPGTLGPAQRLGTVDEVCAAAISLIGNDYLNGATVTLDGGLSALDP